MTILVDDRYRGPHGIGRYASEVLPRLTPPWRPLGLGGSPSSPVDSLRPIGARSDALVYSPGYGALVRAPRQLLTLHDLIQLRTPGLGRWKFAAYYAGPVRNVVRRTGVVLTVSETSARALRRWVDDDDVEIVNAGNGCSPAFHPGAEAGATATTDPYILFVGNGRPHKNLDVVLDALTLAREVRLVAVVPESELPALRARAAQRGVDARVRGVSGVDDERLADLYRRAAATVMPSTLEGFGLPALESIRCGTPVVHWAGCESVAEIVGERGAAVASAVDPGEWAEALIGASASPRRVDAPDGYDWDRTAGIVSQTISRLLD